MFVCLSHRKVVSLSLKIKDIMTNELRHIIDSKRELLRRETISRSPINYSEDMASDQKDRYIGKNGADCYSKNGHAVTVLTRQS